MKEKELVKELLEKLGGRFSLALGIDLEGGDPQEVFKWFLASILFGARISEKIATNTYFEFERRGVTNPDKIIETGWDGLVEILDAGGYVRYDFKTATKLLEVTAALKERFGGDLNVLHAEAEDSKDLEGKLMELGRGVGPVTSNIFLRELRGIWEKAAPLPQNLAIMAARNLGIVRTDEPAEIASELVKIWEEHPIEGRSFSDFETSLVRLGKDYCRRKRCLTCPIAERCESKEKEG